MDTQIYRRLHKPDCAVSCADCNLREICLPLGLNRIEMEYVDRRLVGGRRRVARGEGLYRSGDVFNSIYAVWVGFFKSCIGSPDGSEQVTGFQMGGELLGLDGIHEGRHKVDSVALEDSQVCVIPWAELQTLCREVPSLQLQVHRVMSRELVHHQEAMMLLGSMYAEQRLAAFLLNLSFRLKARGFSQTAVVLRMSREEIASFLGLSIETVSRTFTRFQNQGLLFVRNRQLSITDPLGLRQVLDGTAE